MWMAAGEPGSFRFMAACQSTDPALDPCTPVVARLKPLLLMRQTFHRYCSRLGPPHLLDAVGGGIPLVGGGVARHPPRAGGVADGTLANDGPDSGPITV
jgi:hypothetical protein